MTETALASRPTIGISPAPTSLDPTIKPALLARSWAEQYPEAIALVIILSRRHGPQRQDTWFRTHFITKDGDARRLSVGNAKQLSANGMCPHCGTVVLDQELHRAFGLHPQAGEILMPSATLGASVAKYGATYACSACINANGWRTDIVWDGDLKTPLPSDSEIPNSKLKPIICTLPGKFAWHRDLPYYVEINLMTGTIDVRKEFTV